MERSDYHRMADFLYEIGTMRKILRMHRQVLLTDDQSDNIASHSYRVTLIGWLLAKSEGADPYKTVLMCLVHDIGEIRSSDHNWLHKRYVSVDDEQINDEQLGTLPFSELHELLEEYEGRETYEARVAKDADLLDQVLLLREYEWRGNKEASQWLRGKDDEEAGNAHINNLTTDAARALADEIMNQNPTEWWKNLWTPQNRRHS